MDAASSDGDKQGNYGDAPSSQNESSQKDRLRKEFDTLHREMEIAVYATTGNGQYRRKVPRSESQKRTRKRKLLEQSDANELVMHTEDYADRLRGSKQAFNRDVIAGSYVFHEQDLDGDEAEEDESDEGVDEDQKDDDEDPGEDSLRESPKVMIPPYGNSTKSETKQPAGKKRKVYRMKNFTSIRMAERHGDALGAHARGRSREAVEKLEQVAADAPAAPQVYSSLGLVYESILHDCRRGQDRQVFTGEGEQNDDGISLDQQIELAKKAYGSYHVSAVLCKKDYTLWVRAADTAIEIADLYTDAMMASGQSSQERENRRAAKQKWLEEAKRDFTSADNLKPPGIDVPAKLADVQIQLGNLSEALTLMTDLKNRGPSGHEKVDRRGLFARSYNAWLLYGDLMLRIGHECTQWNRGIQNNENYMFRRWLRKYSKTFDWQERRLQALCLALEAAAGSNSCRKLIWWAKKRMLERQIGGNDDSGAKHWELDSYESGKPAVDVGDEAVEPPVDEDAARCEAPLSAVDSAHDAVSGRSSEDASFETQRDELVEKNRQDLIEFDRRTTSLGLVPGSSELETLRDERAKLVTSQRASVLRLVGSFQHARAQAGPILSDADIDPLPVSASCSSVCSIASMLMKHSLGLNLYEGSCLAGECVSSYFRERARMRERRLEANRLFEQKQKSTEESVLLKFEDYDEIGEDEASKQDDEEVNYLSDDELIDREGDGDLVEFLRNGILPPELRFLYALSLIGAGGRDQLVMKCIGGIGDMKDDDANEETVDLDVFPDPIWPSFRRAMTEQLHRTSGLAFAADLIRKVDKEEHFAGAIASFFDDYLNQLGPPCQLKEKLVSDQPPGGPGALHRNQIAKIVISAARMQIHLARGLLRNSVEMKKEKACSAICCTIDRLSSLLSASWRVEANGSISSVGVESLALLTTAFSLLSETHVSQNERVDVDLIDKLRIVLSTLIGYTIPQDSPNKARTHSWRDFPLPDNWQSPVQREISKRVHNLVVSCNVTRFSGWELEEFNLNLLRRRDGRNHFGIDVSKDRVVGYVAFETETELVRQWGMVKNSLADIKAMDMRSSLNVAKESEWYRGAKEGVDDDAGPDALFGEADALSLFLLFSRLCLLAPASDWHLTSALSVILPIAQFATDEAVWRLNAEGEVVSVADVEKWKLMAEREVGNDPAVRSHVSRRTRLSAITKRIDSESAQQQDLSCTLVSVPVSTLMSLWTEGNPSSPSDGTSLADAKAAMARVDTSMRHLRACYTDAAVARGSVRVAESLLNLVRTGHHCANPFLCLQQAAILASQGNGGGTSDEPFKRPLPNEKECTPLEALMVVGRADCLQALDFPDEAAHLCGYVARVCSQHRLRSVYLKPHWRAIGIVNFNVSVAIRDATSARSAKHVGPWELNVIQELKQERQDGLALSGQNGLGEHDGGHRGAARLDQVGDDDEFDLLHEIAMSGGEEDDDDDIDMVPV